MNYIITKNDCKKNPILKKMGIKAGDTVQLVDVPSGETNNNEEDDPGGGNHPKKPGNP